MSNISNLKGFNTLITNQKTQNYLSEVLGKKKGQFVNNITALISNDENLQKCDPQSILYAGIKATALDLPLDQSLGFAYVIPYKNQAQFQIGYKGFLQLAQRSGQFKTINVRDVRENEIIDEDFISGELTFKRADNREKLKIIGYVAFFELLNGFKKTLYMTKEEIESHGKKFSKSYTKINGVWKTDFDAMAEKTVLKRLITKYAPMSVEMAEASKYDQSVVTESGPKYIDNEIIVDEEQKEKAVNLLAQVITEDNDVITDEIAADIETTFYEVNKNE